METPDFVIKAEPFSWNDNFSELALEDFSQTQKDLVYGVNQESIGMALVKLKMIEDGELEVWKDGQKKKIKEKEKAIEDYKKLAELLQNKGSVL